MFLMRVLPIDVTYEIKERIVLDGLHAARGGASSIEEWARHYCPDEDLWARGEQGFVRDTGQYLISCIMSPSFSIDRWMNRPDVLVAQIDKE